MRTVKEYKIVTGNKYYPTEVFISVTGDGIMLHTVKPTEEEGKRQFCFIVSAEEASIIANTLNDLLAQE